MLRAAIGKPGRALSTVHPPIHRTPNMRPTISAPGTLLSDEAGVTSIEYALLTFLIAMAIIVSAGALGQAVLGLYNKLVSVMP